MLRVGGGRGIFMRAAAAAGASGPFTPADLFAASEAGAWYDPSDFSTLFQDSAETTAVTTAGEPIGAVVDKSGNANDIVQTTAGSRPLIAQDAGGFWYMDGDGVDDFLVTPSNVATGTSKKATVFIAFKPDITTTRYLTDFAAGSSEGGFYVYTSGGNAIVGAKGLQAAEATYPGFSTSAVWIMTVQIDLTTGDPWSDSVVAVRQNGAALPASVPGGQPTYSAPFTPQPLNLFGVRFNGRIYGYIVRFAESTTQEIEDTEAWLNERCGAF